MRKFSPIMTEGTNRHLSNRKSSIMYLDNFNENFTLSRNKWKLIWVEITNSFVHIGHVIVFIRISVYEYNFSTYKPTRN